MTGPRIDIPETGFYWTRLVKDGPKVPARIWRPCRCTVNGGDEQAEHDWSETCDRYPRLRCMVGDRDRDPVLTWPSLAGRAIPLSEFRFLIAATKWEQAYAPHLPLANPRAPIDLGTLSSLF